MATAEEVFSCDRFKENFGIEDIDILLNEAYKVAREVVNSINAPGDKIGVKLENGVVRRRRASRKPTSSFRRTDGAQAASA